MVLSYLRFWVYECVFAKSRAYDLDHLPPSVDARMLIFPARCFIACSICPFLSYPLFVMHAYGYLRCLATMQLPTRRGIPQFTDEIQYAVQRRLFDPIKSKLLETYVHNSNTEMRHALEVVGDKRSVYVDDETNPGVAYMVIERRQLNSKYAFRGENWVWCVVNDFLRYSATAMMCYTFFPAAKRLRIDLVQWWRSEIPWRAIRHPIPNFWQTANDYSKARARSEKKVPADAKPWNYRL